MSKILTDGRELRAVNLFTAPARALAALQHETGLKIAELLEQVGPQSEDPTSDTTALVWTAFLSEHNAGRFVALEEVWSRPLPTFIPDADDLARAAEAAGASVEGPTSAGTGTPAVRTPEVPAKAATPRERPKTRASSGSTPKSRGSKGRSAADS